MSLGDYGGWTCKHVSANAGPCWKCAPASGLCEGCSYPIDDHELVGHETAVCGRGKKAAA